jgi:hypothetical protein
MENVGDEHLPLSPAAFHTHFLLLGVALNSHNLSKRVIRIMKV